MAQRHYEDSAQGNVYGNKRSERKRQGGFVASSNRFEPDAFIGGSPSFNSILEMIEAVAARKCSIIITGETGAGKEMVARQLHLSGNRADKVFVPVDCTTLTGHLFESQLFGHVKGAFTGAISDTTTDKKFYYLED